MNLGVTINEIGVLNTISVLEGYFSDEQISLEAARYIPIPTKPFTAEKTKEAAAYLAGLGKNKLLFLAPEIAIIEALCDTKWSGEIIVVLASGLERESADRIKNNVPAGAKVRFIHEGHFPEDFSPSNGAIVAVGFEACGRSLITKINYRMLSVYQSFLGKKVLVSCFAEGTQVRPVNWMISNTQDLFTDIA